MILDFEPSNGNYIIRAPYDPKTVAALKDEYGLDFWPAASTAREAVFSTVHAYAAAPFFEYATERAKAQPTLSWVAAENMLSRAETDGGHYDVPSDEELSGYQKADLAYMLRREHGVLDADEPGLGKTATAIAYANEVRAKKVLIDCPAQIRYQWLRQWDRWSTMAKRGYLGRPGVGYAIVSSAYGLAPDADVTVTSHGLAGAPGLFDALMREDWDLLIVDEAHMMKTPSATRTRAVFGGVQMRKDSLGNTHLRDFRGGLASRAKRTILLTGTPLPNRPREAYVAAHNLCPESIDFLSERGFGDRFNPISTKEVRVRDKASGRMVTKFFNDEHSGRHAELQARLRAHFMCRHLKKDVLKQLKLPVYDLVIAEETAPIKAALKAESLLGIDPDTLSGQWNEVIGHVAEARRMMGLALAPQAARYAEMLLDGGVEKLTIFYWHIEVGDILQRALHKYGVCRIDGSSTPVVREAQRDRFIGDPSYRVMIGNLLSLGTGTDGLQDVCSYAFIAEPDWVPGNNVQGVQRLDRRGQTQTVNADILVAPGSIAERVLAAALRKAKVTHNALDRVAI